MTRDDFVNKASTIYLEKTNSDKLNKGVELIKECNNSFKAKWIKEVVGILKRVCPKEFNELKASDVR